jgi:hypothetical protein
MGVDWRKAIHHASCDHAGAGSCAHETQMRGAKSEFQIFVGIKKLGDAA